MDTSAESGEEDKVENEDKGSKEDSEEVGKGVVADDLTGGDSVWNLNDNKNNIINFDNKNNLLFKFLLGWLNFH